MQNSNPPPNPSPGRSPLDLDEEALARAYARARDRMLAGDLRVGDIFAAFSPRVDEHADEKLDPRASADPHLADKPGDVGEPSDLGERATFDELLRVFREPIEWGLAHAEQRAQGDPVDVAAIHRVRDAVCVRLASAISGIAAPTETPRIRATDLLIVAGLLVGTVDPAFAQRTVLDAGERLATALGTMLQLDPSLASILAQVAGSLGASQAPGAPHPAATFLYYDAVPSAAMPFGPMPFGSAPFGPAPRVQRPVVPTCCCRHRCGF